MYTNFDLKTTAPHTEGYLWEVEKPLAVVCLIHGIAEHAGRYDRVAKEFAKHGIATVAMDLRGHGLSSGVRGHCAPRQEVLKDIDSLIEYAEEKYTGVPIVLYGHSLGGNLVLDYKARGKKNHVPVKYVVSSPWLLLIRPIPVCLYVFVKIISKVWPTFKLKSNINPALLGNVKIITECHKPELVHNNITVLAGLEGFEIGRALYEGSMQSNRNAENTPMLLMHGGNDGVCNVEGSRQLSTRLKPGSFYVEWEGYYHEIHNGYGDRDGSEVINRIIEFITN